MKADIKGKNRGEFAFCQNTDLDNDLFRWINNIKVELKPKDLFSIMKDLKGLSDRRIVEAL